MWIIEKKRFSEFINNDNKVSIIKIIIFYLEEENKTKYLTNQTIFMEFK
jgi:hypothetical protein